MLCRFPWWLPCDFCDFCGHEGIFRSAGGSLRTVGESRSFVMLNERASCPPSKVGASESSESASYTRRPCEWLAIW